jgi:ribosomal protein S18 acetylase RimI-like enzyme
MNKKLYFGFFLFLSILAMYLVKKYVFLESKKFDQLSVGVLVMPYQQEKHFESILALMKKSSFWLFHDNPDEGCRRISEGMNSKKYPNDFDAKKNVEYQCLVVSDEKNEVLGFITYYINSFFNTEVKQNQKIGRIHLLAVNENYRKIGLAKRLIQAVIDYFKAQGCIRCFLVTRPENFRAKKLYHSLGFIESPNKDVAKDTEYEANPADLLFLNF